MYFFVIVSKAHEKTKNQWSDATNICVVNAWHILFLSAIEAVETH